MPANEISMNFKQYPMAQRIELSGPHARMMELEPRYIDVAVTRWQEFSGQEAVLHGDGRSFDEIAQERQKEAA